MKKTHYYLYTKSIDKGHTTEGCSEYKTLGQAKKEFKKIRDYYIKYTNYELYIKDKWTFIAENANGDGFVLYIIKNTSTGEEFL